MKRIAGFLWLAAALILFSCCGGKSAGESGLKPAGESDLLCITEHDGWTEVAVLNSAENSGVAQRYNLVPKDKEVPAGLPEGTLIRTPLSNALVYTSVHAGAMKELGAIGAVKGVADAQYFKLPEIVSGLKNGTVTDVGVPASPSKEKIVEMQPDAIILSVYEGMDTGEISTLGFPIIKMCDNLESTPLGRAEWIRFLGLLTGTEAKAGSILAQVKRDYNAIAGIARSAKKRPKVLTDNIYQGVWYVPGGKSYQARLIEDAGGNYFKSDDGSNGSQPLSFEEVLDQGGDADVWLIKLYKVEPLTPQSLAAMDKRYSLLDPAKNGDVWWTDTSKSALYEEFPFHPELLLSDYLIIFHPELAGDRRLRYFSKIRQ